MVHNSVISGHFSKLKKDICNFEDNYKEKLLNNSCDSDCYCFKEGNHKITNSVYHKGCISMKKSSVSVKKCDLVQSRSKSNDRKEVYQFDKAQVEVCVRSSSKDKVLSERPGLKHERRADKHHVKLVDTGSDPIMILESKRLPKKCWSTVLGENSKIDIPNTKTSSTKIVYDPPVKLKSSSTSSSMPDNSSPSSRSNKLKQSVIVRDRGIQCFQSNDAEMPYTVPFEGSHNPVNSLQNLVRELKTFKRQLNEKSDVNSLNYIISDLDLAVGKLAAGSYSIAPPGPIPSSVGSNGPSGDSPTHSLQKCAVFSAAKTPYKGLEKTLEETCYQLQNTCLKLEETCQKLRKEKDSITEQFFEKSRELERCLKRELDYQNKLSEAHRSIETMSQKLNEYSKLAEELSLRVKKLQAENKALESTEQAKTSLISQLMEATKENEQLHAQVQLMTLEREKNRVLLDIKEQEVSKLKAELRSIGGLVSEKMLESVMVGDSLLTASRLELSDGKEVVFSSPDGTMSSPSKSWKAMSSIISPTRPPKPLPPSSSFEIKGPSEETEKKHPLESINHLKNELRELFAQMKQQAELSDSVLPDMPGLAGHMSPFSTITDSSDGFNSITENDHSEVT